MAFEDSEGHCLSQAELFRSVLQALRQAGVTAIASSSLWSSPAWPDQTAREYTNAVVQVDPGRLEAQELMQLLLKVEAAFGRTREKKWSSRTLDLDLIDFRGEVIVGETETDLMLPHPRAHLRSFVMGPLQEIAPDWSHPVLGGHIDQYLTAALNDWPARLSQGFELSP